MINDLHYSNRQVLPRWFLYHSYEKLSSGKAFSEIEASPRELESYKKSLESWKRTRTQSFALELIGAAQIAKAAPSPELSDAVSFLKKIKELQLKNPAIEKLLTLATACRVIASLLHPAGHGDA